MPDTTTIQNVAAIAAVAATSPQDHPSHSIFGRLMSWLEKQILPTVETKTAEALTGDAATHT